MATITELTAVVIAKSITKMIIPHKAKRAFFFGGGIKNKYLMDRLKVNLPEVNLGSTAELGFDPDYVEAVCYAVMGIAAIKSYPFGLPRITGAKKRTVAGRIIQP